MTTTETAAATSSEAGRATGRQRHVDLPATMPGRSSTGWWTIGAAELLVHRHDPQGHLTGVAVVVSPPSNEALTTHRTERTLAARLVGEGRAVVRVSLSDVSSSALPEPDGRPLVVRWEDEVAGAVQHAAQLYGVEGVDVVGIRLAGTLAANAARRPDVPARAVVALAPVGSGRQYLRGMGQLLAIAAAGSGLPRPLPAEADGSVPTYGMTLDPASAAHLRGYALDASAPGELHVHVVAGRDKPVDKTVRALVAAGATHHEVEGLSAVLDRVSSYALVPLDIVERVAAVLLDEPDQGPVDAPGPDRTSAVVVRSPREVVCEVVDVAGMPGLLTRPAGDCTTVLVWTPGATEPHDGPAGLWAHMARRLALHDVTTVRFDLADSGERTRPDRRVDAYPYEPERVAEVVEAVRWARRTIGAIPDLGGLCSGAWLSLAAACEVPVRRLVPINPEQWVRDPHVVERIEADPERGLPIEPDGIPDEAGGSQPWSARARILLKERMPYRARVELGRRGVIQAPEPFLEAATASGARVRAMLTQRDFAVFTALHGYRALSRLSARGRDIVLEPDAGTDHGMVTAYTRERAVAFVERALVGTDIFY